MNVLPHRGPNSAPRGLQPVFLGSFSFPQTWLLVKCCAQVAEQVQIPVTKQDQRLNTLGEIPRALKLPITSRGVEKVNSSEGA